LDATLILNEVIMNLNFDPVIYWVTSSIRIL